MPTAAFAHWSARTAILLAAALVASLAGFTGRAEAQGQTLRVRGPSASLVRLYSANCWPVSCWLSEAFAPAVARERVTVLVVANEGPAPVQVTARFTPTNGLAAALGSEGPLAPLATLEIPPGQSRPLEVGVSNRTLYAGLYAGEIVLTVSDRAVSSVPVEIRVRADAIWALLTALFGILLGRLSQLVYDPKMVARLQLLDWLIEIERALDGVDPAQEPALRARLEDLRRRVAGRGGDAASLLPQVQALAEDVDKARQNVPRAAAVGPQAPAGGAGGGRGPNLVLRFLRAIAGISPIPLQTVYDWLMPIFVLLTLGMLTFVFVLQQYGGSGTAETFGAGGLADYAALFLAGVASEAIVGGLRTIRLR